MSKLGVVVLIIFAVVIIAMIGFRVPPKPFQRRTLAGSRGPDPAKVEIPAGLPAPVERFFKAFAPAGLDDTRSVVFYGRGRIKPFGIWLPARFVFIHETGKNYRHYFEATWFGIPILKVNEGYVDGKSFFESPMGNLNDDSNTNQGANLALWAEAGWFPSVWITDARVRWEAVDDETALLRAPFGSGIETIVARFNSTTGLLDTMEAMRYREAGEGKPKLLWIARSELAQASVNGKSIASGSAMWLDQGAPWAYFNMETAIYNADVARYLRARGP